MKRYSDALRRTDDVPFQLLFAALVRRIGTRRIVQMLADEDPGCVAQCADCLSTDMFHKNALCRKCKGAES